MSNLLGIPQKANSLACRQVLQAAMLFNPQTIFLGIFHTNGIALRFTMDTPNILGNFMWFAGAGPSGRNVTNHILIFGDHRIVLAKCAA